MHESNRASDMCPRRSRVLGSMWCVQRLWEETAETSRGQPYSTFTSWTLPQDACRQSANCKRGESTLWVLSSCVGEEDYRYANWSATQTQSREPLCSCQLRMRQVGAALDNLSRAIQEESRKVDLRSQNSLRITNGPTTFTTVQ